MGDSTRHVALITGAAGGLGQGLVRAFAGQGWRVAAGFHRRPIEPGHEEVWPLALDVTRRDAARAAADQVRARWGRIDCLVNNAGITIDQPVWQMTESAWDETLAVNLGGACWCAQAVLPAMVAQRDGHIINIASFSGRNGQRGQSNYAAAKAGLFGFTAALAREVGPHNVRVNAILPGVLDTAMTARIGAAALADFAAANALGRINEVDETARFAVFLAGTRNISGQVFQLDSRISPWT